ncbi:MAG: hypothetical protein BBJ57_02370 [Desulfobacterales bacterium PC51MH44]|nr:MAG: hypothetical protein BBJ57_02370 [Desulfobacterales bacterium PC51MH44]
MEKKILNSYVNQTVINATENKESPSVLEIRNLFQSNYPQLFKEYALDLAVIGLDKMIKMNIRMIDNLINGQREQLSLFGKDYDIPQIITIENEDNEYRYIRILDATKTELLSYQVILEKNVEKATGKMENFKAFYEHIIPHMEDKKTTVKDVIAETPIENIISG